MFLNMFTLEIFFSVVCSFQIFTVGSLLNNGKGLFIYSGLTLLSTHCLGYIMTGSCKGRENQCIPVGHDSAL